MSSQEEIKEYRQEVEDLSKEVKKEFPDPEDDHDARVEWITETVDGHAYIIYDDGNQIVIDATSNEPDAREVQAMAGPDADWKKMRQLSAYMAMEQDIHQALREFDEEEEREEEQRGMFR